MKFGIIRAESTEEKKKLRAERAEKLKQLPRDLMELAERYPETTGGLAALYWAAFIASETVTSQSASQLFQEQSVAADLEQLAAAITLGRRGNQESGGDQAIARVLLNRVKENPGHEKAVELLECICRLSKGSDNNQQPTPTFSEAADLIASHYADIPDLRNFCEILGSGSGSPRWARQFERHLRTIIEKNQDRTSRCSALFALASVVQSSGETRQVEAEELYKQFIRDFDGQTKYSYQGIEQYYHEQAKTQLDELKFRAIGKPAPEIVGVDLEGRSMSLSEYSGKVVLLSFWGTWCLPCMKYIPHEQALATRLEGKPFAIVGVNSDTDDEAIANAVATHKITWRSFRNIRADETKISVEWDVLGWPTLYLIDHEGIIREKWIGGPHPDELNRMVNQLVDAVP
ncbi:MAG: TlpA family protein disulfide reductase [Candidatus Brocadiales bacterium]|nr:TlpA family protein disulfide reductase [Candidatus Bathyanammoxibius sp.]